MDLFVDADGLGGGGQKVPSLKSVAHILQLGRVIPYLKRIQKIHESRDTPFEFSCLYQQSSQ